MLSRTRTLALQLLFCCAMAAGQRIVKEMNNGILVKIGSSVKLEVILSQPGVTSGVWTRQGQPLNDAAKYVKNVDGIVQRLTIKNMVTTDSGYFAYTLLGQTTQGYVVVQNADVLSITNGLRALTINQGQSLILEVMMSQQGIEQGQWYRDGQGLTNNVVISVAGDRHRLVISNAQPSHTGLYSYEVRGLTTSAQQTVTGSATPVNGGWGPWGPYTGTCSATCGSGIMRTMTATRFCNNPAPANGGQGCQGAVQDAKIEPCVLPACGGGGGSSQPIIIAHNTNMVAKEGTTIAMQIDVGKVGLPKGVWLLNDAMVQDTSRTKTSVEGQYHRLTITNVQKSDAGPYSFLAQGIYKVGTLRVDTASTPVNGGWGSWGQYTGTCSATCGSGITRTMTATRFCNNPAPAIGGLNCQGSQTDTKIEPCVVPACTGSSGPKLIPMGNNMLATEGSTISLQVSLTQTGISKGIWLFNGPIVQETSRTKSSVVGQYHRLTITNVQKSDAGNYTYLSSIAGQSQGTLLVNEARTKINGGWGPWGPYIGPECSQTATCGSGITRTLTANRFCNNPAPANGGFNCQGSQTDTKTTSCNLPSCGGADLCNGAVQWNQVGYQEHPMDCDKYIQCYTPPGNKVVAVVRECPFSWYWNPKILSCQPASSVKCAKEKCTKKCRFNQKKEGSCRSYWKCGDNGQEAKCCEKFYTFSPYEGCVYNRDCQDDCGAERTASSDVCDKQPAWGSTGSTYKIQAGTLGWMDAACAPGTVFNVVACKCVAAPTATCNSSTWTDFNIQPWSWLTAKDVMMNGGVATLTVNSDLYSDIRLPPKRGTVAITFKYKEAVARTDRRVLFSTSDCGRQNTLVVSQDADNVHFWVQRTGMPTWMAVSTKGMVFNEWKSVTIVYDESTEILTGVVQTNRIQYISTVKAMDINILRCGLRMGSDGMGNDATKFTGSFDMVSIYKC